MVIPQKSLVLVFLASFLISGILFWFIPYEQAAILEFSFYWRWLVAVAIVAGIAVVRTSLPFSDCVAAAAFGPATADVVRILYESALDPAKHNLWPFELIISLSIGGIGALVGAGGMMLLTGNRRGNESGP